MLSVIESGSLHGIDALPIHVEVNTGERGAYIVSDGRMGAGAKHGCLFIESLHVSDFFGADGRIDYLQHGASLISEKIFYVFSGQETL